MLNKPIGIFDSGVGGLTALNELIKILPNEDIIYFGDTGRVPYGNHSVQTISKYTEQDFNFLASQNVKMIIAACGTVSSVAYKVLENSKIPCCGVVSPSALKSFKITKNGQIGVIGTTATIESGAYKKAINKLNPQLSVFQQDCPLFVPLVENRYTSEANPVTNIVVKDYLSELKDKEIDTLILGCTHYPLLQKNIENFMGPQVKIINTGKEVVLCAKQILKEKNLLNNKKNLGNYNFFVSDSTQKFVKNLDLFLEKKIEYTVQQINIEAY